MRKNCAISRDWVRAPSSMRLRQCRVSAFSDRARGETRSRRPARGNAAEEPNLRFEQRWDACHHADRAFEALPERGLPRGRPCFRRKTEAQPLQGPLSRDPVKRNREHLEFESILVPTDETRAPRHVYRLSPGERCAVPPKTAHYPHGEADGACKFLIVQGVGV